MLMKFTNFMKVVRMVQGFIGGATSYEEQSLEEIILDIENWCEYTKNRKEFLVLRKDKLKEIGFWDNIPFNFQMTLETTIMYFDTVIHDLHLVKNSIVNSMVSDREIKLLRKIGVKAREFNKEYGQTYREEREWKKYGEPDFKIAEEMYAKGRDYFVTMQDASNAAARLEDYMSDSKVVNNIISVGGNISNSQIQQNTTNSSQNMAVDCDFDYSKVLEVLNEIKQYFDIKEFDKAFGENSAKVKQLVAETIEMANEKEEPSKIKKALSLLRDLAVGISGSIIATGICAMIQQLPMK